MTAPGSRVAVEFVRLQREWEAHCQASAHASNPAVYLRHPAFDAIVALGRAAVPLIMAEYRRGNLFWGAALARILATSACGDGRTGDLATTRERWLAWWSEHEAEWRQ